MTENIFRRNVWHNVSSGTVGINQTTSGIVSYTRYYHNTTAGACRNYPNTRYGIAWYGDGTSNSYIYNNIEYKSWGDLATSKLEIYYVTGGLELDYNLAYDPNVNVTFSSPWTTQSHPQSNVNPQFLDYLNGNFTVKDNSGAIGRAGPLTTTSGSGTGTTFMVVNKGGGFFKGDSMKLSQYGGSLVVGDTIRVGNNTLTVASTSGDAITVNQSFTWTDGQPVYYGSSNTFDIGAYPYRPGGYSLTGTYSQSGSTVTVSPSNADLVRFVICYEDGMPMSVAYSSPYICSVGNGSLDVRVYPLFAGKTLYVEATRGDLPPPPQNLRVTQ